MDRGQAAEFLTRLGGEWEIADDKHLSLRKTYRFGNFAQGLDFVNRVGAIAEDRGHHPDVHLTWGRVTLDIWTHRIKGLTENDFEFAAACDRL